MAGVGARVSVTAKCRRTGVTTNAATARNSSEIENTRWMEADRTENPIRNSAGATEAPMPSPTSAEPTSVSPASAGWRSEDQEHAGRQHHHSDQDEVVNVAAC